jgi:hypothetical protein
MAATLSAEAVCSLVTLAHANAGHLLKVLPEARKAALQQELTLLQHSIQRSFPDEEDRARAQIGDLQGIGSSEA